MQQSETIMNRERKVAVLRLIRRLTDQQDRPTLRALGLSVEESQVLENEGLVLFVNTAGVSEPLDSRRAYELTDSGDGLLASVETSPACPFSVKIETHEESRMRGIFRVLGIGLWDLVKIALAVAGTGLVAWFVWKHHWK